MDNRPYNTFEEFLLKTDSSKVRSPTIQALAACGALDHFGLTRKSMCLYCSDLRKKLKASNGRKLEYTLPKDEWSEGEIRALETHFIGEALSGSKEDSFPKLFSGHRAIVQIKDIPDKKIKENVIIEAEVIDLFTFKVKKEGSKILGQ